MSKTCCTGVCMLQMPKNCHSWPFWELYSRIMVSTDSTEHTNATSMTTGPFQYLTGTCKFFYFASLAQLGTLKPPYYNATIFGTRAIRCIYYVYGVFLLIVTVQYTEISHRHRGAHVAWWALGNVTTCHIEHLKMPFHKPSLLILSTFH